MKALPLSVLALAIAAGTADHVRAQERTATAAAILTDDKARAFRELLKNLPTEAEKYGRLHPLPPRVRVPKRVEPERTDCVDEVQSVEEWSYPMESSKSESWKDAIGTIVVCAIASAISKSGAREP